MRKRLLSMVLLAVVLVAPLLLNQPREIRAQANPSCEFVLGFQTLHDMIPEIVGNCIENEWHNPENGDGLQRTTGGLMVWRKFDNWTAFTDGYMTWINGPLGLQARLNTERFAWESPAPPPSIAAAEQAAGGVAGGGVTEATSEEVDGAPVVILRLSDDNVDQDEDFRVTVIAVDSTGLDEIRWWATDIGNDDLEDTRTHACNGEATCERTWTESTDDEGSILIHAQARNTAGRESAEVTLELTIDENGNDNNGNDDNDNDDNNNGGGPTSTPTETPAPSETQTPTATPSPSPSPTASPSPSPSP